MAGISSKEIKNRIRSMENTKQITKAMEMVAASKLRRAQAQVINSRPYFETLYNTLMDITAHNTEILSGYFKKNSTGPVLVMVIAGDRGLAGGYNGNILRLVDERFSNDNAAVLPIGKKAVEFFQSRKYTSFTDIYSEAGAVSIGDCFSISKQLCKAYTEGKYSEIYVAYTKFESMLSQAPALLKLLPLDKPSGTVSSSSVTIYEPNSEDVFNAIIPEYLGGVLYGTLCESRASEQAARRTAMDNATQNAEEMISDLSLKFNRARQAAITQEITEIVAGS